MEEVWAGGILLAFDGRVLEMFGYAGDDSMRFHVRNLELQVDGPDRKGRHTLKIKAVTRCGGCHAEVPEEDWPAMAPFVDRVLAAIPAQPER